MTNDLLWSSLTNTEPTNLTPTYKNLTPIYKPTSLQRLTDEATKMPPNNPPPNNLRHILFDITLALVIILLIGVLSFILGAIVCKALMDASAHPLTTVVSSSTTTATTFPSPTTPVVVFNETLTTQLLVTTTTSTITTTSRLSNRWTTVIVTSLVPTTTTTRPRYGPDTIPICNNSNPEMIRGVNCKYGTADYYINYGDPCPW